jgi:hypothetical protein
MADTDAAFGQKVFDVPQPKRYFMYSSTARRITSGELLK